MATVQGDIINEFKSYMKKDLSEPEKRRIENIKRGQENFWTYCKLIDPAFFKDIRSYQKTICDTLQALYENRLINTESTEPCDILILNLPPGFGKSYSVSLFTTWLYGKNIRNIIIEVSYNQTLSIQFSKTVLQLIKDTEIKGDNDYYCVTSFFPKVRIKYGDSAVERWSLSGCYNSYLSTSFDGAITGMRGSFGIIDDPIKNAEEAVNDRVKEKHWDFYKNTYSSRILPDGKQIIVQTRWATDDLAGHLITEFPNRCHVLSMAALDVFGKSICEDLYPTSDLLKKKAMIDEDIWIANFEQKPIDRKGALYGEFKTYDTVDLEAAERLIAYTDTADEGSDSLCLICGAVFGRYAYITDIYFTDEPMEITEPETARRLAKTGTRECLIESNNGGRGFSRNVISRLKTSGAKKCVVTWFHQSRNKKTRILVNATNVMDQIIMPEGWKKKYPAFYDAVQSYQRKGKNAHDDAADALTGFVEFINGEVKGRNKAKFMSKDLFGGWL